MVINLLSSVEETLSVQGGKIQNDTTPTLSFDIVNKGYVDQLIDNIHTDISAISSLNEVIEDLSSSLSNYVPLSGNTLVSNILSIETDLYVRNTSISDLISAESSRVILREWF